jgi:hypothetical protein
MRNNQAYEQWQRYPKIKYGKCQWIENALEDNICLIFQRDIGIGDISDGHDLIRDLNPKFFHPIAYQRPDPAKRSPPYDGYDLREIIFFTTPEFKSAHGRLLSQTL